MIISDEGQFVIATPTKCGTTTLESIAKRPSNLGKLELVQSDWERCASAGLLYEEARKLDTRRRQHRMAMPWGAEHYRAYLLTRNPYSRWVSVYEYLRAPQNYSQWGARAVQRGDWGAPEKESGLTGPALDFPSFLAWLREMRSENPTRTKKRGPMKFSQAYRSPWVWLDSQATSLAMLEHNTQRKVKLVRLENLDSDLRHVLNKRGVSAGGDIRMVQANKSKYKHKPWQKYWANKKVRKYADKHLRVEEEMEVLGYNIDWEKGKVRF